MAKATKSSQAETPVIETATIIPEESKVSELPKIEEVKFETPESVEKKESPKEILAEFIQMPKEIGGIKLELNPRFSHKERIIAFLESRRGTGKIKLNDFLKSLYPLPKVGEKPHFTDQGKMKRLKKDLIELRSEGEISFINDSFERLGKAHFPDDTSGKTHYYDVSNLTIEVEI